MTRTLAVFITVVAVGGALVISQRVPVPSAAVNLSQPVANAVPSPSQSAIRAQRPGDNPQSAIDSPESIVWSMTDAWRGGDVRKYLDCFGDPLRAKLQRTADEMGVAKFSEFLKKTSNEVKGLAISGATAAATDEFEVPLEFVYQEKNETQPHVVRKVNGVWRIVEVKGTVRIPTLVPYGTEVFRTGK